MRAARRTVAGPLATALSLISSSLAFWPLHPLLLTIVVAAGLASLVLAYVIWRRPIALVGPKGVTRGIGAKFVPWEELRLEERGSRRLVLRGGDRYDIPLTGPVRFFVGGEQREWNEGVDDIVHRHLAEAREVNSAGSDGER